MGWAARSGSLFRRKSGSRNTCSPCSLCNSASLSPPLHPPPSAPATPEGGCMIHDAYQHRRCTRRTEQVTRGALDPHGLRSTHLGGKNKDAPLRQQPIRALEDLEIVSLRINLCEQHILALWHLDIHTHRCERRTPLTEITLRSGYHRRPPRLPPHAPRSHSPYYRASPRALGLSLSFPYSKGRGSHPARTRSRWRLCSRPR